MKKFFFNYFPGGRGDFLVNCLVENNSELYPSVCNNLKNYEKLMNLPNRSVKVHCTFDKIITTIPTFNKKHQNWASLFDEVNKHKLVKIKIVGQSLDDLMDIAFFYIKKCKYWNSKYSVIHFGQVPDLAVFNIESLLPEIAELMFNIKQIQTTDNDYITQYDHIIYFDDLFNINFIQDLYFQIHDVHMQHLHSECAKENNSKQQRISHTIFRNEIVDIYNQLNFL